MDANASAFELASAYLRPRVRIVGGGVAVGAVVGGVAAVAPSAGGWTLVGAARAAFVFGALAFGGGLLGWAGSAMAGRGVERMQEHLGARTDWTEAKSRRAMARIGGFGAGVMAAAGGVEVVALSVL